MTGVTIIKYQYQIICKIYKNCIICDAETIVNNRTTIKREQLYFNNNSKYYNNCNNCNVNDIADLYRTNTTKYKKIQYNYANY